MSDKNFVKNLAHGWKLY